MRRTPSPPPVAFELARRGDPLIPTGRMSTPTRLAPAAAITASPQLRLSASEVTRVVFGGETCVWLLGKANEACSRLEAEVTYAKQEEEALLHDLDTRFRALQSDHEAALSEKAALAAALTAAGKGCCVQLFCLPLWYAGVGRGGAWREGPRRSLPTS